MLGVSYKDIEKALNAVLKERQITPAQQEMIELQELAPEKFEKDDLEFEIRVSSPKSNTQYLDPSSAAYRAWVTKLVSEYFEYKSGKKKIIKEDKVQPQQNYRTYSQEEVRILLENSGYKKS